MHSLKNRKRGGLGGEELMSAKNTKAAFRSPQATTHVKKVKGYEEMARHTARSTKVPEFCSVVKLLYSSLFIFQLCSS